MKQEELTFNDLPAVVGELCNRNPKRLHRDFPCLAYDRGGGYA